MTIQTRPMTAKELLHLPDDGKRHDLVRGELREMPPAGSEHGHLALRIASRLERHIEANALGRTYAAETGFKLASNPDTVRAPDAAFVSRERVEAAGRVEGYWPGAPDLAVEVISPGDTHSEVTEKALDWLGAGCRMVWVVDPRGRTVTIYRSRTDIRILTVEGRLEGSEVVEGFGMAVAEVFT